MPLALKHESSRAIATQVWVIIPFPKERSRTEAGQQDKVPSSQARLLPATRCKFIRHLFSFCLPLSCLLFPFPFSVHPSQFLSLTYTVSFALNTEHTLLCFQDAGLYSWLLQDRVASVVPSFFVFFLSRSFKYK